MNSFDRGGAEGVRTGGEMGRGSTVPIQPQADSQRKNT